MSGTHAGGRHLPLPGRVFHAIRLWLARSLTGE